MRLTIDLIADWAGFEALRDDWRQLSASLPGNLDFFATWDYTRAYLSFHQTSNWCVVTVRDADTGQLQAVMPLKVFQLQGPGRVFRACQPLGVGYMPYVEFPLRSQVRREVFQQVLSVALRDRLKLDVALFWPLHEASPLYLMLQEDLGGTSALKVVNFAGVVNEIEARHLPFEDYVRGRKSLTVANARACERKLRRRGNVRVCLHERGHQVRPLVIALCRLNQQKFPEDHVHASRPLWADYMGELVSSLSEQGLASLATLRIDDQVISSAVYFRYKGRCYFYLYGYDPQFASFSPSKILLSHLIESVFAERGVFCFGAGSYAYKLDWSLSVGDVKAAFVFLDPDARQLLDAYLDKQGCANLSMVS